MTLANFAGKSYCKVEAMSSQQDYPQIKGHSTATTSCNINISSLALTISVDVLKVRGVMDSDLLKLRRTGEAASDEVSNVEN